MDAYYDTGALIPLYVDEVFSETVNTYAANLGTPIPFSLFHKLEFENALRLKVFRREFPAGRLKRILADMENDLVLGRLVLRPMNWIAAFDKARSIGAEVTLRTGCRTLDLVHVAIAVQWGCPVFVSAEERQLAAANMAGLKTIDLRELHRRHVDDRTKPKGIREPKAGYGLASRKPKIKSRIRR